MKKEEINEISQKDREFLLDLARKTIVSYLKEGKRLTLDEKGLSEILLQKRGCFVTLKKFGNLRGCIGDIFPTRSLYKSVIDNAINAAVNDYRFPRVKEEELKDIKIEISVLTVPKELKFSSPQDLLDKLRPLADGVVLTYENHRATFLPQVWEDLKDKEEFLSHLCSKAGVSPDCWKKPGLEISIYQAEVFGEEEKK